MAQRDISADVGSGNRKVVKMDLPSNSHRAKREDTPEKSVKKVVKGGVKKRKKPLGNRLAELFLGEDIDNVGQYVIHDVLIPAAKNAITDMVTGGIEMALYGETRGRHTKRDKGRSNVSYNNYYNRGESRQSTRRNKVQHEFDDIVLESRPEAEEVLSHLVDLTVEYGQATVADLYDLVGITSTFADNKWGWESLGASSVHRVRDGYALKLPRTIALD